MWRELRVDVRTHGIPTYSTDRRLIMPRRSNRWLAPAACIAIGIVWVLWLAHENEFASDLASERAPPSRSATVQSDSSGLPARDHVGSYAANPDAGAASPAARAAEQGRASNEPSLRFAFETPANARIGEAFDLRVAIEARQPIGRIVFQISYDAALLKVRSAEELDYSQRTPGEHAFSIDQLSEGRVTVVMPMAARTPGQARPTSAPVVQFEALAPGWAQVTIANISVSERNGAVPSMVRYGPGKPDRRQLNGRSSVEAGHERAAHFGGTVRAGRFLRVQNGVLLSKSIKIAGAGRIGDAGQNRVLLSRKFTNAKEAAGG